MTTALEEELGAALAARAASLPPDAAARVRGIDYRPRRHRRVVPLSLGAGAVAGAATVGTVFGVVLGGESPAYAGWSATPTAASGPAAPPTGTEADCQSQLSSMRAPDGGADPGPWQPLLTDVRGPFVVALFQAGNDEAACFTGPSFIEVNRITSSSGTGGSQSGELSVSNAGGGSAGPSASGHAAVVLEGTSSGDLSQVVQNILTTSSDGPYTFVDGRVAPGVSGVTLAVDNGQHIVATVADGWFVAWWPTGDSVATSAQVVTSAGTKSEPLVPAAKLAPAPTGSCTSTAGTTHCVGSAGSVDRTGNSGNSGGNVSGAGNSGGTGAGPPPPSKP